MRAPRSCDASQRHGTNTETTATVTLFSANLGFLWNDVALPDAIRRAAAAGFDAVECHWPYDCTPSAVLAALDDTGLTMIGLNTARGSQPDDFGLAAVPDREDEARQLIRDAVTYAEAIDATHIHVMAGRAGGTKADNTFIANVRYAADLAAQSDRTVLIEPLNRTDNPGYFLHNNTQAADLIAQVERENVQLMFDCYHAHLTNGDVTQQLRNHINLIGHVQFASAPTRSEPDRGDIDYVAVFATLAELGWDKPVGAEYRPSGRHVEDTLGWMSTLR